MIWDFFMEYKNKDRIGFFLFLILFSVFLMFLVSGQSNPQIRWSNESLISSSNNFTLLALDPSIATDSQGNIHIIWMQKVSQYIGEVFYSKLDKLGNKIIDDKQLSNFSGVAGFKTSIAVDKSDNIHIIWEHDKTGTLEHFTRYTRLDKNGNIVVNGIALNGTSTGAHDLEIDSQGNIVLVWGGDIIYYAKFDNLGNPIIKVGFLNRSSSWDILESIKFAIDSNDTIHIVWAEENVTSSSNPATRVTYSRVDSNGNAIIKDLQLDKGLGFSTSPDIAVDKQDNIYLSWYSSNKTIGGAYLSKMDRDGKFVIDKKPIPTNYIGEVIMGVDPLGNINLLGRGQGFLQLNSTGDPIIGPYIIGPIEGGSGTPKMAIDRQGGIHFVWHVVDRDINRYNIRYRKSFNPATISLTGVPKIGSKVDFEIEDIYGVNTSYYFGLSLGNLPGMNLADGRNVPLNDDYILRSSLGSPNNMGLVNSVGRLDSNNQATISFNIPNISSLNGTRLYGSFITVDSQNRIISIADSIEFTVV